MSDVTHILRSVDQGDSKAAEKLLPLVYEELRRLAAQMMAQQPPGQTLQATALVHEAYLKLVDGKSGSWDGRKHFFCAAAEGFNNGLLFFVAKSRQHCRQGVPPRAQHGQKWFLGNRMHHIRLVRDGLFG